MMDAAPGSRMIVNPFASDNKGSFEAKGQRIERAESIDNPSLEGILAAYETALQIPSDDIMFSMLPVINALYLPVLPPFQINTVLQHIRSQYSPRDAEGYVTELLMKHLMLESFKAGNNDFLFDLGNSPISRFPSEIPSNEPYNKLIYTILGKTDKPQQLIGVIGIHKGDILDHCPFSRSLSSRFTIYGDVKESLGTHSESCRFEIYGNAGDYAGQGSDCCAYTFHGELGDNPGKNTGFCYFQATRPETYERLCRSVETNSDNIIQLIKPDGTVLEEVRR